MEIIKIGQKVFIGKDIEGTINQALIKYGDAVAYKVVWWDGRSRMEEWFYEDEISGKTHKVKIGYRDRI